MPENRPGTYLIQFYADKGHSVQVGRLGELTLKPGHYCYVGSAFGPGGIRARVKHHLAISTRPHWHLDYVRPYLIPESVWFCYEQHNEHRWAGWLAAQMSVPLDGFGASDCDCETHFFHQVKKPQLADWQADWANAVLSCIDNIHYFAVT